MLIITLAVFNMPVLVVAEEGGTDGESTEQTSTEGGDGQEASSQDNGGTEGMTEGSGDGSEATSEGTGEGEATSSEETGDASIETGDGTVVVDVENQVNTNVTDLTDTEDSSEDSPEPEGEATEGTEGEGESSVTEEGDSQVTTEIETSGEGTSEEGTTEEGGGEESAGAEGEGCEAASGSGEEDTSLEVTNENETIIENDIEGGVGTGENSASNNSGDASIGTGDAVAVGNLSNVANTNIIASNFWFYLTNLFYNLIGDINLTDFSTNQTDDCGLIDCINPLDVSNDNVGSIVNNMELYAVTGANTADENEGDGSIDTGNALAIANISNVLNTNIIGSDWLFTLINSFGNWQGDLILPGAEAIAEIIGGHDGAGNQVFVENNDEAVVENNVNATGETGDNLASDNEGGSSIETGDAFAQVNVATQANTSIFGSNWLMVAVKVFGNWSGSIHSLPEGVSWLKTPDGLIIFNENWSEALSNMAQANGEEIVRVANNNFGEIINNLDILASTGANSASNNAGQGIITTGNAGVRANIANFVNTNIIGRNWLFGLINIFGDWQGNLSFGQPDLWLGLSAETSSIFRGSIVNYTLSYINNGDAEATDVTLVVDYDDSPLCGNCLMLEDPGSGDDSVPGQISWQLDPVPVGGSGSVTYSLRVSPSVSVGEWQLVNVGTIDCLQSDANDQDNTDVLSFLLNVANRPSPTAGPSPGDGERDSIPELEITKTNDVEDFIYNDDLINYKVVLTNQGDESAYDVVVTDEFSYGDSPEVLKTNTWELGEVFPDEEIIIEYSLMINGGALAGEYVNTAQAIGVDIYDDEISSNVATSTVELVIGEEAAEEGPEEYEGFVEEGFLTDEELGLIPLEEAVEAPVKRIVEKITSSVSGIGEAEAAAVCGPECEEGLKELLKVDDNGGSHKNLLAGMTNLLQNGSLIYFLLSLLGLFILALIILLYLRYRRQEE